ncbi:MAG: hypothetical protein OEV80_13475, partial [candidate division Zixibacteria bacterium]|nr:hypothetical protein [candidate division Zixibacteria bacterium]
MSRSLLGLCVVVCTTFAVSTAGWGVDIPFEFFYGRWATGHQPSGQLELHKGDGPKRMAGYRYSSEKWRAGLSQMRGKVFYYNKDSYLQWPVPSFYLRPAGNWQIGLDSLKIEETIRGSRLTSEDDGVINGLKRSTDFGLSASWLNSGSVRIHDRHAAFSYFHRPLVGRGNLRVDASIWFREQLAFFSSQSRSRRTRMSSRREVQRWWTASASVDWGLNDYVEVSAMFYDRFFYWSDLGDWFSSHPGDAWYQSHSKAYRSDERPHYELAATVIGWAPVYVVAGFGQRFRQRDYQSLTALFIAPDSTEIRELDYSTDLSEEMSHLRLAGRYLNTGSFQPEVLLDDYSGFYHRMLFHGQTDLSFDLDYRRYGSPGDLATTEIDFRVAGRFGLWNYMEVGVDGRHRGLEVHAHRGSNRVSASGGITVAARSYRYQPGQGPGWDRDGAEDIAFGPLPPFAHLYFMADYRSPTWYRSSRDKIGFLSLKGLRSDRRKMLTMSLT